MPGSFFDTNILIYATSGDPPKADRAQALIFEGGVISVQVLNEIANVARRKIRMTWPETNAFLATIRGLLSVQPTAVETTRLGLRWPSDMACRFTMP